jgi:hypothetical protein
LLTLFCCALLVLICTPLPHSIGVRHCPLVVFYWCLLAPLCSILLVFITTFLLCLCCVLLVFVSTRLLCSIVVHCSFFIVLYWCFLGFQIGISPLHFLCKCIGLEIPTFPIAHIFQHSSTRFFLFFWSLFLNYFFPFLHFFVTFFNFYCCKFISNVCF